VIFVAALLLPLGALGPGGARDALGSLGGTPPAAQFAVGRDASPATGTLLAHPSAIAGSAEVANWSDVAAIAADPNNPVDLVAVGEFDAPGVANATPEPLANGSLGVFVSADAGASWRAQLLPGSPSWGDPSSPECGLTFGPGASIAFGVRGIVYVLDPSPIVASTLLCNRTAPIQALLLSMSNDSGRSWGAPRVLLGMNGSSAAPPLPWARLAADPLGWWVNIVYPNASAGAVDLLYSLDHGQTWSHDRTPVRSGDPSSVPLQIGLGSGFGLDLVWIGSSGTGSSFHQWLNQTRWGANWSSPTTLATAGSATRDRLGDPAIAEDNVPSSPTDDWTYVSWARLDLSGAPHASIEVSYARVGAGSWSDPVRATDASTPYMCCSSIAVGVTGALFLSFSGLAFSDANATVYRPMVQVSQDRGASFSAPLPLADAVDVGVDGAPSPVVAGAAGGRAVVLWTDVWSSVATPCSSCPLGVAPSRSLMATSVVPETLRASVPVWVGTVGVPTAPNGTLSIGPNATAELVVLGSPFDLMAPASVETEPSTEWFAVWYGAALSSSTILTGTWETPGEYSACYVDVPGSACRESGAPGFVALTVRPPQANVTIDGTEIATDENRSGAFNVSLPAGNYSLAASAPSYATVVQTVSVAPGTETPLRLSLVPLNVTLAGRVAPADAEVSVDERAVAVVEGSFSLELPWGEHVLNARARGFDPLSETIDLVYGGNGPIVVALTPAAGWIVGTVSPVNATVTANDFAVPVDPQGAFNLSVTSGRFDVVARLPGYSPWSADLSVAPGVALTVNVSLQPYSPGSRPLTWPNLAIGLALDAMVVGAVAVVFVVVSRPPARSRKR